MQIGLGKKQDLVVEVNLVYGHFDPDTFEIVIVSVNCPTMVSVSGRKAITIGRYKQKIDAFIRL